MALLLLSGPSWATYSIIASDSASQQVGGAGTSCLGGGDVYRIYGSAPGFGAVQAQAQSSSTGRDQSVLLLGEGVSPAEIIAFITAPSFDSNAASRQYGVVDLQGRASGFTGDDTLPFADDQQGSVGFFTYSVQGNILTSELVLDNAATAFESGGCDLAERLLLALEAGGSAGEGDSRCTDSGIPSDSAFLQVDRPLEPAGSYLELHVPTSGNDNPLPMLRSQFDEWRLEHPCPSEPDAGVNGSAGTGGSRDAGNPAVGGSASGGQGASTTGGQGAMVGVDAGFGGTPPSLPTAPAPAAAGSGSEAPAPSAPPSAPTDATPGPAAVVAPPASTMAPLIAAPDVAPTPSPSAGPSASTAPSASAPSGSSSDDGCKCALRSEPASPLGAGALFLGLMLFARRRAGSGR